MVIVGHAASVALLFSFAFVVADAIRPLKDGPMIDAEGREYKSAAVRTDAEEMGRPRATDGSVVRVQCTDVSMIVVVNARLVQNGPTVSPGDLFLGEAHSGGRRCRAAAVSDTEYVIEAGLRDCGSKLVISEDSLIYSNKLVFSPAASYHGGTRRAHAVVPVSCQYQKPRHVSGYAPPPQQQQPLTLFTPAVQYSAFSLKLMTGDWKSEMFSSASYVGDLLHLEASYAGPDAGQRRLFIDHCVATLTPDAASVPRYYFIENHGCVTDAKQGGSNTMFKPRLRTDSLRLQLDAFLFHRDPRNSIFITCQLTATSELWKSGPINKACNYVHSSWTNEDGDVGVCQCCDRYCQGRSLEDVVCGTVTLGPLMIFPSK
ncbi:zona pellucida sperm-binding protein 3-like [Scophthalmus maximus]|uniref:zona pellucida sperm-binding protein 3-like n=1 Tax=Scophthalmus maximus TaxID=52904 RepID=UPI0015E11D08|nr:zona pellucida sperm-binding protein 3-like [Scophthalmus maximus]